MAALGKRFRERRPLHVRALEHVLHQPAADRSPRRSWPRASRSSIAPSRSPMPRSSSAGDATERRPPTAASRRRSRACPSRRLRARASSCGRLLKLLGGDPWRYGRAGTIGTPPLEICVRHRPRTCRTSGTSPARWRAGPAQRRRVAWRQFLVGAAALHLARGGHRVRRRDASSASRWRRSSSTPGCSSGRSCRTSSPARRSRSWRSRR